MKLSDKVEIIQPVLKGEIIRTRYNEQALCLEHLVDFDGLDERHNRWFFESELRVIDNEQ